MRLEVALAVRVSLSLSFLNLFFGSLVCSTVHPDGHDGGIHRAPHVTFLRLASQHGKPLACGEADESQWLDARQSPPPVRHDGGDGAPVPQIDRALQGASTICHRRKFARMAAIV